MSEEATSAEATPETKPPSYPGISATVNKLLPQVQVVASETKSDVDLRITADQLRPLVEGLKEKKDLKFDFLRNIVAIDMEEEGLECKYHFYSFTHGHALQVTVDLPPGETTIPSIVDLYAAADWHEREAAEMIGLVFDGHPDLRNLLLEEDLRIHPLLKAHPLQKAEVLQGIEDGTPGFEF